jgi:hypothetical protein
MNAYPIDNLWKKGHYMQRLAGPDPKWEVAREFVKGRPVKSRGTIEVTPDDVGQLPAWILRASSGHNCGECGRPDPTVELIAAHPHGWEVVGSGYSNRDLLAIWTSGAPGDDPQGQVAQAMEVERVPVYAADKPVPFA